MEKLILKALEQINEKLDSNERLLKEQVETLKEQGETLKEQGETLKKHGEILNLHSEMHKEHSGILGALKNGQEVLKAEINELRLQNAKDFGEIKEHVKGIEVSVEILKEESWNNKKDIKRIQKTMGMA